MSPRWRFALWIMGGIFFGIMFALVIASVVISRNARAWTEDWLRQAYHSEVRLAGFHVTVPFPFVQAEGRGLTLYFQGREDLPPLLAIERFLLRTSVWELLRNPHRIDFITLDGLQINVPPREDGAGRASVRNAARKFRAVRFNEIRSENAVLRILTRKPGKNALEFDMRRIRLSATGREGALEFGTTLSNPTPPGEIVSTGIFGPWNADSPSLTPLSGSYLFEKADLSVFRGIAGTLSSRGQYEGALEKIRVAGTTDTPDFHFTWAGHPVDLSTRFDATVDGTDGDTYLHSVEAHFGQTTLLTQGKVEGTAGRNGKTITLDVSANRGRIEDLLRLAIKAPASMTGPIRLKTNFVLQPGPQEIPDRLNLDGSFGLDSIHFTSSAMQQRVDNLSERSQGRPKEARDPAEAIRADDVASKMQGNFRVANGVLSLSPVTFQVSGADVRLVGTYTLDRESLDLYGTLAMEATLSRATMGIKSFLLKFADPFFSKDGKGAVLPIKISGAVQHPQYALDLHHKGEGIGAKK